MIGWMIAGGYVAGWVFTGRMLTLRMQENEIRRYVGLNNYKKNVNKEAIESAREQLGYSISLGFLIAILWPLVLPVFSGYLLLLHTSSGGFFTTKLEKDFSAKEELKKLRAQAAAYGLPMGDEK